ncbi:hypothetical protein Hanom_Chr01g00068711 [Helianthus anomalus]
MGLDDDFDVFNNAAIKEIQKKVDELEKDKAKAEAERDELKKQVEELMQVNKEIKSVMIKQQEKLKKVKDGNHDNSQLFEILLAENVEMREKMKNLQDVNQTLNQLLSEINEASSNEMKAMKLEMEAMKADKVMKDEQLYMLYFVIESHLNIDVHAAFNNIEVKRAEEHIVEKERRLAEEATQKNKSVIEETQEASGSSSQVDVEMVEAEADPQGFVLIEEEEVEEEEEEEATLDDNLFEVDSFPEGNDDDDDQGMTGLLIVNPNVQHRIEDFLNDEISEQEDDDHQEDSTYGNQNVDQVYLTQPIVIYLNAQFEGEIEVPRSRAEMLEELGLDDGKFKFEIEDEIPASPEKEFESRYA